MSLSQDQRVAKVTTALGDGVFVLYRMTGSEAVSRLFEYQLELLSESGTVDLKALLGTGLTVELALENGGSRWFNGIVTRVNQLGMLGDLYNYRVWLHPKAWLMTRSSNCRVLSPSVGENNQAAPTTASEIVKSILGNYGIVPTLNLNETYPEREFCVQYRETDFNLVSRLMEEEGIYYYFQHHNGSHTMVLCDNMQAHQALAGNATVKYYPPDNQGVRDEEHIFDWTFSRQIQSGGYYLNEYDFEAVTSDLKVASLIDGEHAESGKEIYDYPGEYKTATQGERYARLRMEQVRSEHEQIFAGGNVRGLATGLTFTLAEYPRADQNCQYMVLSTDISIRNNGFDSGAGGEEEYLCTYSVIKTAYVYRPPRLTRVPVVQGVQTAVVVGAEGDEILTDQYGRVKVQFHWDRLGTKNENSSCWVRVAQIWAGKNWGSMFIPRVGQEVVVDFLEGNPDNPIITGRVYNSVNMPPYGLDANKTQSGIKTRSTPNGEAGNFNELRFEDKKDEEEIYMQAEKNFTRIVKNNDVQKIGFERADPGDQTIDIYNHRTVTLDQGNDKLTVKTGNRTVEIKQGNDELTVSSGNRTVSLGSGNLTVKLDKGAILEEAEQSIELRVGSSSIKLDQSGVTIKGMTVKIQADTQAELKGLQTSVNGDGTLTLKGGVVMIN
ncbi:type VI secretion system Vgr family protein [Methylomonas sp. DH-1]|uniref:type VI secretion system Vgr family protein n=1 Tax=Methylomonas sp. (strain DH-1) TaxID=1727196 RepID=UPI0007C97538|nr:type VI secretion system tip protein VgrG [Methylomonas sp. DH-1]ANE57177.1 type VI secretion protein ImpA [Methylomonas sp. DH-1]